jgi:single-strand DNA-binding protein
LHRQLKIATTITNNLKLEKMRNKVQLIGNLGMDPEVKTLESGKQMVRFSLATNETYKNAKGDRVTETQWHNLVAWGKTADLAGNYLKKGSEVAVEGKLVSRSYNDKEGTKKFITEIVVNEFLMLGSKN